MEFCITQYQTQNPKSKQFYQAQKSHGFPENQKTDTETDNRGEKRK